MVVQNVPLSASAMSRHLARLRVLGLIKKVAHTYRYYRLFSKSSGLHSVRVDGGEVEFSGNQEDDCPDGSDTFEAACTAFGSLE